MIIGNEFIEVFAEEARKLDGIEFLAQGTITWKFMDFGTADKKCQLSSKVLFHFHPGFPRIHTSLTLTIRPETLGNIEFNCIFTCHPIHSVV